MSQAITRAAPRRAAMSASNPVPAPSASTVRPRTEALLVSSSLAASCARRQTDRAYRQRRDSAPRRLCYCRRSSTAPPARAAAPCAGTGHALNSVHASRPLARLDGEVTHNSYTVTASDLRTSMVLGRICVCAQDGVRQRRSIIRAVESGYVHLQPVQHLEGGGWCHEQEEW
eukprot:scaffold77509_cov75-Phaeocystis_antarctica.AAC.2